MTKVALWTIESDKPVRLPELASLEKHIETWIENDGSLVIDGVIWIGRQITLPGRGRLDLLGLTREGQIVVAELKAGPVDLAALHQALGYAMTLGTMDADDLLRRLDKAKDATVVEAVNARLFGVLLVGTSRGPDLEPGLRFLEEQGLRLPIRVVTFELFAQPNDTILLARQIDDRAAAEEPKPTGGVPRVLDVAGAVGLRDEMAAVEPMAVRLGLPLKAWPSCLTINSPANKRKTLLYVGPRANGAMVGYAADTYAEAFGIAEADVVAALGPNWQTLPKTSVTAWLAKAEGYTKQLRDKIAEAATSAN